MLCATAVVSFCAAPVRADLPPLEERVTAHFRFHYPKSSVSFSNKIINRAEGHLTTVLVDLPIDDIKTVDVYILPDLNLYFDETPSTFVPDSHKEDGSESVPDWVIGMAIPSSHVILLRLGTGGEGQLIDVERTFIHELSHICLHDATAGHPLPLWLVEGFAIYQAEEWTLSRSLTLVFAGLGGNLIPLQQLTHRFPYQGEKVDIAYAESFHFLNYLFEEFGKQKFRTLLELLARGEKFEPAFRQVYKVPFFVVERDWRKRLERNYTWFPVLFSGSAVWFVASIIFVLGFLRKRRRSRDRLKKWEEEEEEPIDDDFGIG